MSEPSSPASTLTRILASEIDYHDATECPYCGNPLGRLRVPVADKGEQWISVPCSCPDSIQASQERLEAYRRETYEAERQAWALERVSRIREASGLNARFAGRRFETYDAQTPEQQKALATAKHYAERWDELKGSGKGLWFAGTVGTGKTHLSAAIANDLLDRGIAVRFVVVADLLTELREGQHAELSPIWKYRKAPLLILDDMGKERLTEWGAEQLFTIINGRYEANLPTIYTTNASREEIAEHLGPRAPAILSRINETCAILRMSWADHRREATP